MRLVVAFGTDFRAARPSDPGSVALDATSTRLQKQAPWERYFAVLG